MVRTRVQLIQRDRSDGRAVHGEGVAGIAWKVRERVWSSHGGHVHLRVIFLTTVILQEDKERMGGEECEQQEEGFGYL